MHLYWHHLQIPLMVLGGDQSMVYMHDNNWKQKTVPQVLSNNLKSSGSPLATGFLSLYGLLAHTPIATILKFLNSWEKVEVVQTSTCSDNP